MKYRPDRCIKNQFHLGVLMVLFTFGALPPAALSKSIASSQMPGWVISQSSNVAGTVFSEITGNALRMKIGRLGLIFTTKGPEWNASVYNEATRNFVEMPYKVWRERFTFSCKTSSGKTGLLDRNGQLQLTSHATGKFEKICKFKAAQWVVERKANQKLGLPQQKLTELWIASDIKAPPEITQIFCSRLNVPVTKGIPLKAVHLSNGRMVSVLETLAVEKKLLPASLFEPIKGYRRVKDELALMMDESAEDMVNDLLDSPSANVKPSKQR